MSIIRERLNGKSTTTAEIVWRWWRPTFGKLQIVAVCLFSLSIYSVVYLSKYLALLIYGMEEVLKPFIPCRHSSKCPWPSPVNNSTTYDKFWQPSASVPLLILRLVSLPGQIYIDKQGMIIAQFLRFANIISQNNPNTALDQRTFYFFTLMSWSTVLISWSGLTSML